MWRIHLRSSDLAICHVGDCAGRDCRGGHRQAHDAPAPASLRAAKGDALAMHAMRQIVQRHDPGAGSLSRMTDDQVLTRVDRLLDVGSLRLCGQARIAAPTMAPAARDTALALPPPAEPAPRRRATPATTGPPVAQDVHWIEIEMVGEDGVGVAGQEYLIVTPDKRRFTGVTDARGRARVDGIVAGQCSVSFRNLDQDAWRLA